jgi:hypothetical protein
MTKDLLFRIFQNAIATLFLAWSSYNLYRYFFALKYWIKVQGVISKVEVEKSGDSVNHIPFIRYTTIKGEECNGKYDYNFLKKWVVTEKLNILYDRNSPEDFVISSKAYTITYLLLFILGADILYENNLAKVCLDLLHCLQ